MSEHFSYPHIEKPAGKPARLRRWPRMSVQHIACDYIYHGWSVDEMCRQHTFMSPAEAHAAMCYYFDHQGEMDAEIDRQDKDAASVVAAARSTT